MFKFLYPELLLLWLLIPCLALLFVFSVFRGKQNLKKIGSFALLKSQIKGHSKIRPLVKVILQLLSLAFIVTALARPLFGVSNDKNTKKRMEIVFALDLSNSMLAKDVSPSRLEKAKQIIANFLSQSENDKIGLVTFAGDANIQVPLTTDYNSIFFYLNEANPSYFSAQGTNIPKALEACGKTFTDNRQLGKAIVLITDVENHEEDPTSIIQQLNEKGIKTFVIVVGTDKGTPIQIKKDEYLKDENNNIVLTKINPQLASDLAKIGGGECFISNNNHEIEKDLLQSLSTFKREKSEIITSNSHAEQFQIFTLLAFLLLLIDSFLNPSKIRIITKKTLLYLLKK